MLKDKFMSDEIEALPGNRFIYLGEANNFFNGKSFSFIGAEGKDVLIDVDSDTYIAFNYYYNIWEDFHELGVLPHGSGTLKEFPWVPDIIKYFNRVNREIDIHKEQKQRG